jgi:hypothetical protein
MLIKEVTNITELDSLIKDGYKIKDTVYTNGVAKYILVIEDTIQDSKNLLNG